MADGTIINQPSTIGQTIATKEILGVNHELVLLEFGDGLGGATEVTAATPLPVVLGSSTSATVASVAYSASNVTLLASSATRKMAVIYNNTDKSLYIKLGATASTSSFTVKVLAGGYFELPIPMYSGQIDGIWDAGGSGAALVTSW